MVTNLRTSFNRFIKVLCISILPVFISAKTSESVQLGYLERDVDAIESILKHNELEKSGLFKDISNLNTQIQAAERVIRLIINEESNTEEELIQLASELLALEQEIVHAKKQYQKIILQEYKYRDYKNKLLFLVSSTSINQFITRLRELERLKSFRKRHLTAISYKKQDIENKIKVFSGTDVERQELTAQMQVERSKLSNLLALKHASVNEIERENNMLQLKMDESQTSIDDLTGRESEDVVTDEPGAKTDDFYGLSWPTKHGLVVGRFGVQKHMTIYKLKVENNGIDILVSENSGVLCIKDGTIKAVFEIPGSNTSIIVNHGNYYSVYNNVQDPIVKTGDVVKQGNQLATIAKNDEHLYKLHFELWKGTKKVDPLKHLKER